MSVTTYRRLEHDRLTDIPTVWVKSVGEVPSPAMRKKLASKDLDIRPTNGMLLKAMLGSVTEIAGYLSQRTWTLVRFADPCLFTGKTPVVHINPSGDTGGFGDELARAMRRWDA